MKRGITIATSAFALAISINIAQAGPSAAPDGAKAYIISPPIASEQITITVK